MYSAENKLGSWNTYSVWNQMYARHFTPSPCCTNYLSHPPLNCQLVWKKDLSIEPDSEDSCTWTICIHKGIMNVAVVEATYKVYSIWYLVPNSLSHMYSGSSSFCFWGCEQPFTFGGHAPRSDNSGFKYMLWYIQLRWSISPRMPRLLCWINQWMISQDACRHSFISCFWQQR